MSELWKSFECQRCGKCCEEIGLPYDPESAFKIADFLGITIDDLIENYYGELSDGRKEWTSQDHKRTPCPFLQSEGTMKRCEIYEVRPKGCRLYPFNTDGGRAGVECPGAEMAINKCEEIHRSELADNEILGHFDLLKIPFNPNHLAGPIANVKLASHSMKKIKGEEHTCLSPDCINYQELICKIDLLKKELDELAEQGEKFFAEEFKRREEWRKSKNFKKLK